MEQSFQQLEYRRVVTGNTNEDRTIRVWTEIAKNLWGVLNGVRAILPPGIGISQHYRVKGVNNTTLNGLVTVTPVNSTLHFVMPPVMIHSEPVYTELAKALEAFRQTFPRYHVGGSSGYETRLWVTPL